MTTFINIFSPNGLYYKHPIALHDTIVSAFLEENIYGQNVKYFSSVDEKDVEIWTEGVSAVLDVLSEMSAMRSNTNEMSTM